MPNLRKAMRKAGSDFWSDVSTVPTERMMQHHPPAQRHQRNLRLYQVLPRPRRPTKACRHAPRLFDGISREVVGLKEFCACFDCIRIRLAKALSAPVGSVILGSRAFIERAKWVLEGRRDMCILKVQDNIIPNYPHRPSMMAAAANSALTTSIPQLPRVHEAFVSYCTAEELQVFPFGRLVFHYQTSEEAVEGLMVDRRAEKVLGEWRGCCGILYMTGGSRGAGRGLSFLKQQGLFCD
ncbi:hypothetical protein GX48_06596 [Paracoccidioides brasiliensis]|nr:hypothetical protein GX48_06596 [Paracoccidioides brasiliensis]